MRDPFEDFLEALEELIDARDDAWIEEENHNWKQMQAIEESRIVPARERMRRAFDQAVRSAVDNYPAVQKTKFIDD